MTLIATLITLAVQRWLCWDTYVRRHTLFDTYYQFVKKYQKNFSITSGWANLFFIILPPLIVYILILLFFYYVLTQAAVYILSIVVLWYFMDAKPSSTSHLEGKEKDTTTALFIHSIQYIFSFIFWMFIFGSAGVILYALIQNVIRTFSSNHSKTQVHDASDNAYHDDIVNHHSNGLNQETYLAATQLLAVLDWIPMRLVGLTYALLGHFSFSFNILMRNFVSGITESYDWLAECGRAALDYSAQKQGSESKKKEKETTASTSLAGPDVDSVRHLINRSLLAWLVVIALCTIGYWIG